MSFMGNRQKKRVYGKIRSATATIARERIDILLDEAEKMLPKDPELSRRYVGLARKISMRTRVRIPREKKWYICKNCGQILVLGKNARVRLSPTNSRILVTCLDCGVARR